MEGCERLTAQKFVTVSGPGLIPASRLVSGRQFIKGDTHHLFVSSPDRIRGSIPAAANLPAPCKSGLVVSIFLTWKLDGIWSA